MGKFLEYWTGKPFSKPQKVTETKSGRVKVEKCRTCGKGPRQCRCHEVGEAIKTRKRTGRTHDRIDKSGIIWCGVCNMRCHPRTGVCMNVTCSSRKKR